MAPRFLTILVATAGLLFLLLFTSTSQQSYSMQRVHAVTQAAVHNGLQPALQMGEPPPPPPPPRPFIQQPSSSSWNAELNLRYRTMLSLHPPTTRRRGSIGTGAWPAGDRKGTGARPIVGENQPERRRDATREACSGHGKPQVIMSSSSSSSSSSMSHASISVWLSTSALMIPM